MLPRQLFRTLCLQPRGRGGGAGPAGGAGPTVTPPRARAPSPAGAPRRPGRQAGWRAGGRARPSPHAQSLRTAGSASSLAERSGAAVAAAAAPGRALRVLVPLLRGRHLGRLREGPRLSMLPDLRLRSRPGGSCDGGGRGCGER